MTIRYLARILLALLVTTALGCGGGGGGGGSTSSASPTKATLTLSIPSVPTGTLVGGASFIITLPPGVSPATLTGTDASGSVTLTGGAVGGYSSANFTSSATAPQISIASVTTNGFGTGAFMTVNCVIASGTTVSTSGFSLSDILVIDTSGTSISSATVSMAVELS